MKKMPTLNPLEHDGKNRSSKDYRFLFSYGSLNCNDSVSCAEPDDIQDSDFCIKIRSGADLASFNYII